MACGRVRRNIWDQKDVLVDCEPRERGETVSQGEGQRRDGGVNGVEDAGRVNGVEGSGGDGRRVPV